MVIRRFINELLAKNSVTRPMKYILVLISFFTPSYFTAPSRSCDTHLMITINKNVLHKAPLSIIIGSHTTLLILPNLIYYA